MPCHQCNAMQCNAMQCGHSLSAPWWRTGASGQSPPTWRLLHQPCHSEIQCFWPLAQAGIALAAIFSIAFFCVHGRQEARQPDSQTGGQTGRSLLPRRQGLKSLAFLLRTTRCGRARRRCLAHPCAAAASCFGRCRCFFGGPRRAQRGAAAPTRVMRSVAGAATGLALRKDPSSASRSSTPPSTSRPCDSTG